MSADGPDFHHLRAFGQPPIQGRLRTFLEDFQVKEITAVRPTGEGEHLLLRVRKRGANTDWVAGQLATKAGVRKVDVGYAGLKDRNAVAEQWFSIHLPGRKICLDDLSGEDYELIEGVRHNRKIRRGALRANRFRLTVREISGNRAGLEERLRRLSQKGVPNYFGEQRFGLGGANLRMTSRRKPVSGIQLSAYRSILFNKILSRRVEDGTWDRVMPGECVVLDGSQRFFRCDCPDDAVQQRADTFDVHPSGALWGKGLAPCGPQIAELEAQCTKEFWEIRDILEKRGLKQERRALRMRAAGLSGKWISQDVLSLEFELPRGSYATTLLGEILEPIPS